MVRQAAMIEGLGVPDSLLWQAVPHSPSPRVCRLLGEVAMCAGEMEALHWKMGALREAIGNSDVPDAPADAAELEAESVLADYLSRCSGGVSRGSPDSSRTARAGLSEYLPVQSAPLARMAWGVDVGAPAQASRRQALPLGCPAAASWQRCRQRGSPQRLGASQAVAVRCECDPRALLPHVCELEDLVQARATELRELQRELRELPAPAELSALAGENSALARRTRDGAASVARLRTETSSLAWSVDFEQHRARELRAERKRLLGHLGELERAESEAGRRREQALAELELERRSAGERALGHEGALAALTEGAENAERRWSAAEDAVARCGFRGTELEADGAEKSRAAALDVERHRLHAVALEAQLNEQESSARAAQRECDLRRAAMGAELAEARAQAAQLRGAEDTLAAQLVASRRRGEETEQKALSVARELVDASQGIAWLRAEVLAQQELRQELQEAQQRATSMRQQLQELQQETVEHARSAPRSIVEGGEDIRAGLSPDSLLDTEQELSEARAEQIQAVNEALQAAWEAETREHRSIQRELAALQACAQPVQKHLVRLTALASLWRESLLRSGPSAQLRRCGGAGGGGGGEGDRGGGFWPAEMDLPAPPAEFVLDSAGAPRQAMAALCACFEALAIETSQQLAEAEARRGQSFERMPPAAARCQATDAQALRAERLALERELERLTPPSAGQLRSRVQSTLMAAAGPTPGSSVSQDFHETPSSTQARHLAIRGVAFPPSPMPTARGSAPVAGVLRSSGRGGSVGSSMSSISLHDHRSREEPMAQSFRESVGCRSQADLMRRPAAATKPVIAVNLDMLAGETSELPPQPLQHVAGPLYRLDGLDATLEARLPRGSSAQLLQRGRRLGTPAATAQVIRRGAPLRQIPNVRRNLEAVLGDDPSDRFDADSVYRRSHP